MSLSNVIVEVLMVITLLSSGKPVAVVEVGSYQECMSRAEVLNIINTTHRLSANSE